MWEKFPPQMRKMIVAALEEAGRGGHEEAGPEHLLLAMVRERECAGAAMLGDLLPNVEAELRPLMHTGQARAQRAAQFSSGAMHVLDVAAGEAVRMKHAHVGTEHVALAFTRINSNVASEVLGKFGFDTPKAEAALRQTVKRGTPRQRSGGTRWSRMTRVLSLPWNVYVRKSLGHPRFVTDPYPLYRWLREREPVRRDPIAPVWVITRYDDTMTMMRDPRFKKDPFASQRLPKVVREQLRVPVENQFRSSIETVSMLFLDPPEHTRIRGIFTKAFTMKRLEALRPRIQLICDKRLDRVKDGQIELMGELAAPLPVTVIAELLGFPPEDFARIKKWSDDMAEALGLNPNPEAQARAAQARDELRVYFDEVVKQVERSPGDNLLSALLAPDVDVLNREELFTNSVLLLAAGHETTTHLIGNGVLLLLEHPEQMRALRENPSELMAGAIEEILRYECPVQWTSRVAGEEIEMRGKRIKRGEITLASVGAANRDPAMFSDPERFDIYRTENRHLSFGAGPHFCLGATLARMEASIAIGTLLSRFPNLRLGVAPRQLKWQTGLTFRGLKTLPLRT